MLDNNDLLTEGRRLSRDCPATSATSTYVLGTTRRQERIEKVELMVDADYAASSTLFYAFTLQVGATVIASWSTQTAAQGALTAGVPVSMVLATGATLLVAAGAVLKLVATKASTAADITPRVLVHSRVVV